jgi:ATP-dependent DNA helicase PIF1
VAILCPHNDQSLKINEDVLSQLPGETKQYRSTDTLVADHEGGSETIPVEFLHELTPSGMPKHILNVKVGAVIMLLRNINVSGGMCNGTRLQVTELLPHLIAAKLLTGPFSGEQVFLPRISVQPSDSELQIKFTRRQFPIRLSFAMTINKAQGQTFQKIGLCLQATVFSHGQLYVALSRCRRQSAISIRLPAGTTSTKNIVYPEALQ